jgi:hypothetical protein
MNCTRSATDGEPIYERRVPSKAMMFVHRLQLPPEAVRFPEDWVRKFTAASMRCRNQSYESEGGDFNTVDRVAYLKA